ncbi:MAG: peptide deformylase [Candidatus Omnitrophica bacterium]|nr:peptide deformylase [Candidatus Omnitrophota bacterium]
MAILKVVQYPDPILLRKTQPVTVFGSAERDLVRDMIDTMHAERGVGLAANQIGVDKQIFVVSADGVRGQEQAYFNPTIIKRSGKIKEFEGCLSVRETYEPVIRFRNVTLSAQDADGKEIQVEATDLLSRIFQHEVDHLNGITFVHRLGWFKKKKIFKILDKVSAGV